MRNKISKSALIIVSILFFGMLTARTVSGQETLPNKTITSKIFPNIVRIDIDNNYVFTEEEYDKEKYIRIEKNNNGVLSSIEIHVVLDSIKNKAKLDEFFKTDFESVYTAPHKQGLVLINQIPAYWIGYTDLFGKQYVLKVRNHFYYIVCNAENKVDFDDCQKIVQTIVFQL